MLVGGNFYFYSCKLEDVWVVLEKDWENLFFIDVQVWGMYLVYFVCVFCEKGVIINKVLGDDEILKNIVDFVFFSYYVLCCVLVEMNVNNSSVVNVVKLLCNLYLQVSDWGWGIDLFGLCIIMNMMYDCYQKLLFLVENGLGVKDEFVVNGEINDDYCISYLCEYICVMGEVIVDGILLMGYIIWGCIDLVFVFMGEMSKCYGFVFVDCDDVGNGMLMCMCKKLFWWYKKVIVSNGEDLEQVIVLDVV